MGFFDTEEGVQQYERMAEGYDGRDLIARFKSHVPEGASVLELGMGPGKDLDMLLESYRAVGSDNSKVFLDRYRARSESPDLIEMDAVVLDTDRTFDAIYSNKVLHHLTRDGLAQSLQRQLELLKPGGVVLHSLWCGDKEEEHSGLRFIYYTEETFAALVPAAFTVVEQQRYAEMEENDSFAVVLKKVAL